MLQPKHLDALVQLVDDMEGGERDAAGFYTALRDTRIYRADTLRILSQTGLIISGAGDFVRSVMKVKLTRDGKRVAANHRRTRGKAPTKGLQLTDDEFTALLGYLRDAKSYVDNGMVQNVHPENLKFFVEKSDAIDALRKKIASQAR